MWYVIHPDTGERLCKDNKWRGFACFGTYSSCVKPYKRKGNAERVAHKFRVNGVSHIINVSEGEYMDASGKIFDEKTNRLKRDVMNSRRINPFRPKQEVS